MELSQERIAPFDHFLDNISFGNVGLPIPFEPKAEQDLNLGPY